MAASLRTGGKVIGSALIGQNFADEKYFHGRPSATTDTDPNDAATAFFPAPYNAANSAGSNAGPTAKSLIDRVKEDNGEIADGWRTRPTTGAGRSGDEFGQRP